MAEENGFSTGEEPDISEFHLDNIEKSIQELDNECTVLEQELQELVTLRKAAENMLEKARIKFNRASHSYTKVQETLAVANQKANRMDNQAKSLEERNSELRVKIQELQEEIKRKKQKHLTNVENFEENLRQICNLFQNAVTFYTDDGLMESIRKTEEETENTQRKLDETKMELAKVRDELDAMMEKPPPDQWALDIALEQRKVIVQLFRSEHASALTLLENLNRQKEALKAEVYGQRKDESVL